MIKAESDKNDEANLSADNWILFHSRRYDLIEFNNVCRHFLKQNIQTRAITQRLP